MEQEPPTQPPGGVVQLDAAAVARAFALARREMSTEPAQVSGYRLFWVQQGRVAWTDLSAGGPYAILGSHPYCNAVLSDPGIALRHVLATTVELSDGPALRLLDLHSDLPFRLQDGSPQRSIVGVGSVVAHLAGTVFGGVPIEAGRAPEVPAGAPAAPDAAPELPDLIVSHSARVPVSVHAEPEPALVQTPAPPYIHVPGAPSGSSLRPRSRVTSMPPSRRVADLAPPTIVNEETSDDRNFPPAPAPAIPPAQNLPPRAAAPRERKLPGEAEGNGPSAVREIAPPPAAHAPAALTGRLWSIALERGPRAASVTLTEAELSLGVVIGRAPNCHDEGLRAVLDNSISRGHLLLLHHHDTIEAYDLCSINGTWEAGKRVRRRRLDDEPVTLGLTNHHPVLLRWYGRG